MLISVDEVFRPYVSQAVARLSYLHPTWAARVEGDVIVLDCEDDQPKARKEVMYTLYREKIFADGLPLRQLIAQRLMG